jgi:carbamoyl-phosphate synthase large subunit
MKKKINILVTAVGGDIGSNIVAILSNLETIKINIIGTDINKKVFPMNLINNFYTVDKTNSKNYKKQILNIISNHSIDIIIPVSEKEIIWFDENINIFNSTKILMNYRRIIHTFLNKSTTANFLNKINIEVPKTFLLDEYKDQLPYPLIIKSNYSIFSKKIFVINNKEELKYAKASIKDWNKQIIQEYIGSIDNEYTTTVYKYGNKIKTISFKRKLTCGMTSFATIVNEKKLDKYAIKIAKAINLEGSINIQSRKYKSEFFVFEINPRISSTVYIRDHFGFKDLIWWIEDLLKLKIKDRSFQIANKGKAILGYKYNFYEE